MKIAMLANNPCTSDTRIIREASALSAAGHDVYVLAHAHPGSPEKETIEGVHYWRIDKNGMRSAGGGRFIASGDIRKRPTHRPTGLIAKAAKSVISKALSATLVELLRHRKIYTASILSIRPDIIHAHDLNTLLAGAAGAKRTGSKLIYDSHELELGKKGNFSRYHKFILRISEAKLIRKADAVITVCDSIADHLADHYHIDRPVVLHNAPAGERSPSSDNIRTNLNLGSDVPLCICIGKVANNRGLDVAIRALQYVPKVHLAIVGPRDEEYASQLHALRNDLGFSDRVHFIDAIPHHQILDYVSTADVSLVLIQNVCLSYYMSFPNKLLESLLAGLPILAARLVELERVVAETGAGIVVAENDPQSVAQGIETIMQDREKYVPNDETLAHIQEKYGWERQKAKLMGLYEGLQQKA